MKGIVHFNSGIEVKASFFGWQNTPVYVCKPFDLVERAVILIGKLAGRLVYGHFRSFLINLGQNRDRFQK